MNQPLFTTSPTFRWVVRAICFFPLLCWLVYLNWAGPKHEGKRLREWVSDALPLVRSGLHNPDAQHHIHVIQALWPEAGERLLERIPSMSDAETPSPLAKLMEKLPSRFKTEREFASPADRKAAHIILASEMRPPREQASQVFWEAALSPSEQVRYAAAGGLVVLGGIEQGRLVGLLTSDSAEIRELALGICSFERLDPEFVLPHALRIIERGERDASAAVSLLGGLGPSGHAALSAALASTNLAHAKAALRGMRRPWARVRFPVSFAPFLLAHARPSADAPALHNFAAQATQALGQLEELPPEAAQLLAEALASTNKIWASRAQSALRTSAAPPEQVVEIFHQTLVQTDSRAFPSFVETLGWFVYASRKDMPAATNAPTLAEALVERLEIANISAMPLALPVVAQLGPRSPIVQSYLSAMVHARNERVVTRALWGLARTELASTKKAALAEELLRLDPPPPALFYFLRSMGANAEPLLPTIKRLAETHQTPAVSAAARAYLNDHASGVPWDGKILVSENGWMRRMFPELIGDPRFVRMN